MLVKKAGSDSTYFVKSGKLSMVSGTLGAAASSVQTVSDTVFNTLEVATGSVTSATVLDTLANLGQGSTTPVVNGNLTVSLSANTPVASNVVKASEVEFSKFIFRAGTNAAAIVNSVKIGRKGLGATGNFTSVTLYDGSTKLGSTKSSWNSDGTMTYNVSGGWTIPAGTSKELTIAAVLGTASSFNSLGLTAVTGEGLAVAGLPIYGNQMSGVDVTVGVVEITNVDASATKKIGTSDVTLAQFKLAVDSTENAKFESLTFKNKAASPNAADGDIKNLYLYQGSTVLAGPVSMVSDKVTFVLNQPYAIDKSKNQTFKIVGDVVNGASNLVEFNLDTATDLKVRGLTYNTFLTVTDTLAANGTIVTIDGAELNVAYSGTNMETVADKTDVVFGTLTLSAGATDIKISSMEMNIVETDGDSASTTNKDVDNFQLVDTVGGGAYSGTMTGGGDTTIVTEVWTFTDEIYLNAGETRTFEMRGDLPTGIGNGDSYKVTMTVATAKITAETAPAGDTVDNFSIASFTGKTVTVKKPTLKVTGVTMNSGTAVVNDENVILYSGALEASADNIRVTYANFDADGDAEFTVANWTEVGFYLVNADGSYSLQQSVGSSSMTDEVLSFDSLDFTVLNGPTHKVNFVVKGKVAATVAATLTATLHLDYFTAKDTSNIDATFSPETAGTVSAGYVADGTRVVTLADTGILFLQMVNNVAGYNKDRVVLAGSSFWAGELKVKAQDENIKVKDLKLTNSSAGDEDSIDSVCLYTATTVSADNLIGCSSMDTSDVVFFDNIDKLVTKGTEYWYIYVTTKPMNNLAAGTADSQDMIQLSVATSTSGYLDVEGEQSGISYEVGAHDGTAAAAGTWVFDYDMDNTYNEVADNDGTAPTKSFYVAGTRISTVTTVSTYGGETVATSLDGTGPYTAAIVAITAEGNNTDANGNPLKLALDNLLFDVTKFASTTMSGATIKRINGVTAATALSTTASSTTGDGANDTVGDWTLSNATTTLGQDAFIESGTTAYFVIKPTITALVGTTNLTNWVQVGFDDLKGGVADGNNNIDWFDGYDTTFDTANNFDYLFLDTESITGTKISAPKNN
ncbi:MAG: hypothetical protein COX80_05200 [Candidatus Magasanikbacteria bacterium CG_4_10_14_0_2_um_filter_33_14]|uniref:Uncharacterized protein n=1 Tax=Candidatus Magasanikbacteria bacterium CG_4_10_14_0_2_um_filter_33_14 TaxID=1974636 RepID=A0A2M7V871_9BACT|nr:MAG: hypothetical protein COX80_05200 [Candidatus Magasanikbacteria bacterium CG_4_10_14_0_2_um_filter_33_14]